MESKGHQIAVIAKDRNVTHELLESYNINFISRKDYPRHLLGKLITIPATDLFVVKEALEFKPQLLKLKLKIDARNGTKI